MIAIAISFQGLFQLLSISTLLLTVGSPRGTLRIAHTSPAIVTCCLREPGVPAGLPQAGNAQVHDNSATGSGHVPGPGVTPGRPSDAGSGLRFADRGIRYLKGVPGEWRLFAVERG